MRYDWLVTVILAVHFGYLAYVVFGGFLAWRWPKAYFVHLAAAIWGILIVLSWVDCPLTWAEKWARERNGEAPRAEGFIDRYVTDVLYPQEYLHQARAAAATVVLIAWVGALILWRRRQARTRAARAVPATPAERNQPDEPLRSQAARLAQLAGGPVRTAVGPTTADTQVGDTGSGRGAATV